MQTNLKMPPKKLTRKQSLTVTAAAKAKKAPNAEKRTKRPLKKKGGEAKDDASVRRNHTSVVFAQNELDILNSVFDRLLEDARRTGVPLRALSRNNLICVAVRVLGKTPNAEIFEILHQS